MATVTHDVVATIGKYTDRSGKECKRYINIGKCFTDDQGRQSIKLDSVPVSPEWSGWISLYPVKEREQQQQQRRTEQDAHNTAKSNAYQPQPKDDDEIPF